MFATIAFAVLVVLFAVQLKFFYAATVDWARSDLESQTILAARTLQSPIEEQDFKRIRQFGESCRANSMHLQIVTSVGGTVFDTRNETERSLKHLAASADAGEYTVRLFLPLSIVERPFRKAFPILIIAALSGVAGMLVLFFTIYRQRVKIRQMADLEKFRKDFIADISHEIRTPLTGILTGVEMLGEENDGKNSAKLIRMIGDQSRRINDLVGRILELSKLERDVIPLDLNKVDMVSLIASAAEKYGCRFSVNGQNRPVLCDRSLVLAAVENLLENAFKYSGTEDVAIALEVKKQSVDIVVEDHGVGIPAEYGERIFERFFRLDMSRSQETGGSGLGLAIVRRIARLHQGEVKVYPADPQGARFVLTLKT